MISSDTKYAIKLGLSKNSFFKNTTSRLLLLAAQASYQSKSFWSFCKLLGKYEKLNEDLKSAQENAHLYKRLTTIRTNLIDSESLNHVHANFLNSKQAKSIIKMYGAFDYDDRARIRYKNEDDPLREGNLLVLKEPRNLGSDKIEKGVLYLQYNNSIIEFAALFDIKKVYEKYVLVVEPSSWGYSDIGLELLLHGDNPVYVMAQDSIDFNFCLHLDKRLIPIRAGAGDWINLAVQPLPTHEKLFDVCMVASWRKLKNHKLMFEQLSSLGKGLRIALIGYPWESRTAASIRKEQSKYYPDSLVSIFECIPHEYVFRVLSQSKIALMLSEREGANRGIYEALASNIPVVMLDSNRGVNKDLVTQGCVVTTASDALGSTVGNLINAPHNSNVREKLLTISGTNHTWMKISEALRTTEGIELGDTPLIRSTPNLKYIDTRVKATMDASYALLKSYLY